MPRNSNCNNVVKWLSQEVMNSENIYSYRYYDKFQFNKIVASVGDFVLVSNADAAEPDIEEGCDVAQIMGLYEDSSHSTDPFRAKVQWFSRPADLPKWCFNNIEPIQFFDNEVIEDHRPFDKDVSIEAFFKKCTVNLMLTKDTDFLPSQGYHYVCRYRLMALSKRKVQIEPVLQQERDAIQLLRTPTCTTPARRNNPKTPTSLIKKVSSISLADHPKWSISKNDGTKILLKKSLFTDKSQNNTPKTHTSKAVQSQVEKPYSSKKLAKKEIEDYLDMELRENDGDELPTLVIKCAPKNKQSELEISSNSIKLGNKNFEDNLEMELTESKDNELPTLVIKLPTDATTAKRKKSTSTIDVFKSGKLLKCEEDIINEACLTPSRRRIRNPVNYKEPDLSPLKRTPKKMIQNRFDCNDDDFKLAVNTPRTPRTPRTPKTSRATPNVRTPRIKEVKKRILTSQLTPSLRSRAHSIDKLDEILNENNTLPGRESQLEEILSFVRNKLLNGISGCMYISGVPGTGKTATVCAALKILKKETDLPDFQLVEVNGMRISEPRNAYVQIYKQLTGKTVVWEQACTLLNKRFTNPGPRRTPTVLLVDELDALCTRKQDVLYSIMEWGTHNTALLTVLAVANTMDLPERALKARVASRLGLTRMSFPPYTHTQLQQIVATRLAGTNVTPDAIQLIARKVAALSGDARRALALCSRSLELAGPEGAGLEEVQRALGEALSSATVRAIRACSGVEKLMLRAVAAEVERTGTEETTLSRALSTAAAIVLLDGRPYSSATSIRAPTPAQALAACARLASQRLLLQESKASEPKLLLNVSVDDVHYATRQILIN